LQRAIDIIRGEIEWKYRFPVMEEKDGKLVVTIPEKLKT